MFKFRATKRGVVEEKAKPIDILMSAPGIVQLPIEDRIQLSSSCRDTDYIYKVKNAGDFVERNGQKLQVMHNGLEVVGGGYFGDWMSKIISNLKGHHEPQEEKVFYEVLARIGKNATMIELGSFWAYYSLWFSKSIKGSRNICCEPDADNLEIGKNNFKLNNLDDVIFIQSAAGSEDGKKITFQSEINPKNFYNVPIRSVDSIYKEQKLKKIDLLHIDVQGVELDVLRGAETAIDTDSVRFIFISTHHYSISGSPSTHAGCLEFLKNKGAHIISSHTILESFSGDGLIVASFDKRDANFEVETSLCHTDKSLFRPYEKDLQILINNFQKEQHD